MGQYSRQHTRHVHQLQGGEGGQQILECGAGGDRRQLRAVALDLPLRLANPAAA